MSSHFSFTSMSKVINHCRCSINYSKRKSDDLIKDVIRRKFTNNTIVRIACRLDPVMDCDKIIVLECGRIVEIGHPYELIQTSRGYFRSLLDESGLVNAMNLIKISERNYFLNRKPTN